MRESFEFDKIIIAIAIAMFTIIMSANIGSMFYIPHPFPLKKGFKVDVAETTTSNTSAPQGLPTVIDMAAIMSTANHEAGKQVFTKCAVCHTIAKNEPNKIGPNLWGIVGAPTARHTEFSYSSAMQNHSKEGGKWGFEELYRYLYAPKQYIPGTKMAFAGIKNDSDRANLIAYLRIMSDRPLPISTS
ncbi:putative cytochrome C transmembrane protein [Candidatus Jidaibacter acanthamoeba]|uniref:Cytochrome c homolog n=1 Tax=Candidatus Jidaibacter acanthamoebae TaxID=86105 RepID=A0A0C1QX41_9RICK|nr:cytochrome c family protein [Candidatus Jidaibacter acanthamoeba]KIE04575.1 putative cytochrome C transmembrane protein [Candidatus Jidaibacter acanthamoeba]